MTLAPHYPTRYLRPKVATHFQNSTKQTDRLTVICFVLTTRKPRWLGITSICPTTCWLPCKVAGSIPCAGLCQRLPEYLHHAVQACVLAGSSPRLGPLANASSMAVCVCVCVFKPGLLSCPFGRLRLRRRLTCNNKRNKTMAIVL